MLTLEDAPVGTVLLDANAQQLHLRTRRRGQAGWAVGEPLADEPIVDRDLTRFLLEVAEDVEHATIVIDSADPVHGDVRTAVVRIAEQGQALEEWLRNRDEIGTAIGTAPSGSVLRLCDDAGNVLEAAFRIGEVWTSTVTDCRFEADLPSVIGDLQQLSIGDTHPELG
jgi:hypothetical protein